MMSVPSVVQNDIVLNLTNSKIISAFIGSALFDIKLNAI